MYDIIGDIHGHALELKILLEEKLGYVMNENGVYCHPDDRKVIFLGDYIDRGPEIPEVLRIVRKMAENNNAVALMGNHEYNAVCFLETEGEKGDRHLRPHSFKNIFQHINTLWQFHKDHDEYYDHVRWFMTLPLYFETKSFRAVHACWDTWSMDHLSVKLRDKRLDYETLRESADNDKDLFKAIEIILKGKEMRLPDGHSFLDKDKVKRHEIRVRWWENQKKKGTTYRSISINGGDHIPEEKLKEPNKDYYSEDEKPVFFGHYWLKGEPKLFRDNICCLDYSVARKGALAAYRWNFEERLSDDNFLTVDYIRR